MQNFCKTGRTVATITARCGRMLTTLLFMLLTTTSSWAQSNSHWEVFLSNFYEDYKGSDMMAMSDCYQYHRPMGCIENVEMRHGSITVSGWALDLDGDHRTSLNIILKQGDVEKYNFYVVTNQYRSNIEGNAYFRGQFGFISTWQVAPGTYEMYAFANNSGVGYIKEPISSLPIGFKDQGYVGLDMDWNVVNGNLTYYHKTITVQPCQYQVIFHVNYEGGIDPSPLNVPDNIVCGLPYPPSRPGYTFVGWSKSTVLNESAEVYATWMPGKGTKNEPWTITTLNDWNIFCKMCIGSRFTSKSTHVRLESDLTVTKRLDRFSGEFDGGGHTITNNSNDGAIFHQVFSFYIHDLKEEGTVCLDRNEAHGGLANYMSGSKYGDSYVCTIENCVVSVDFTNKRRELQDTEKIGTFIGEASTNRYGGICLKNCTFNGSTPRKGKCEGFVGLLKAHNESSGYYDLYFENCLFAPREMAIKPTNTFTAHYESATDIYYTEPGENVQGEQAFVDLPVTGVYTAKWLNDKSYLVPQSTISITSDNIYFTYTGSPITNITYTVSRDGTPLSANDYTSVFRNEAGETMTSPQAIGAYRHEVTIEGTTYFRAIFVTGPLTQSEGVYQINSVADWMTFAADVAAGNTYSGSTVRLNADITTSAMVGTENHKFSGTFDGNGHTLTFNYQSALTVYDPTEDLRAPFRYINGTTIRNLTVAGTTISTGRQMGGLVAYAVGDNYITDCTVDAMLITYLGGDASSGGFIAHVQDGSTAFSRCVFAGYMLGSHAHSNGGFVGWSGGTLSFNDCLFNPKYVNMMEDGSSTFARSSGSSFANTYYTTALGELQGTQAYGAPQSSLCDKHTMANGRAIYMVHSSAIEGLAGTYAYNGGSDVTLGGYYVKYNDAMLPTNKYTVTIRNSAGEEVSAPTAIGRYTLTVTGNATDNDSEGYCGAVSQDFWVVKTLTTDASGFYQIADEDDWCSLDYYIQNTTNCKAKLTADIGSADAPITTMLTVENHPFNGVIDGSGHTLTVNLTGAGFVAPFIYVCNATFVNLNVAGTVRATNEGTFTGGIVAAMSGGSQNFVSCRSSVNVGCSGGGTAGGFVAHATTSSDRNVKFRDCLFDGILSGPITYTSGFVGYHNTAWPAPMLTLTNCLMNGTTDDSQGEELVVSPFYSYHPSDTCQKYNVAENSYHKFETIPACYTFNDDQGSFTALAGTELQTLLGDGWIVDGSDEVVPKSDVLYTMNITVASDIAHGTVECPATGVPGYPVNLTLTPEGGYLPTSVSYNDGSDHSITPQDGSYSFIMPDADVTVSVTFSLSPNAVGYIAYNTETKQYENRFHTSPTAIIDETTGETDEIIWGTVGNESWYIVNSNITISKRIYVNGTVHLILADGESLTAQTGITVSNGNKLYIYGQEAGTGALTATGAELGNGREAAAIGSEGQGPIVGEIAIHGGVINATGWAWTAAIGGGVNNGGGTISIYGGIIHAVTDAEHSGEAKAIGNGSGGGDSSKTIADGLRVYFGNSNTPVNSNNRVNSLSNKIVTVEPCTEHNYNNNVCTYCGLIHHYTLTYNGNGATSGSVPEPREYLIAGDKTVTVISADNWGLERTGYTFNNWNTAADGSGTAYKPGDEFTISEMVTLYAQWDVVTYQIDYDLDGGTLPEGQSNPVEYTIESGDITLVNPTRNGRFFMGWAGIGIDATAKNVTIPHGSTGDRYFTAIWDDNEPPFAGMEIDHDLNNNPDEVGRYYVKMPAPEQPTGVYYEDENGDVFEVMNPADEDFPVRTVNIPEGFTTTFKVYDSGGKNGEYCVTGGITTTLILTAPEGKVFSVSGDVVIATWYDDWLKIYDGTTTEHELDGIYSYEKYGYPYADEQIIPFVTTGNSIRIDLYNDPYNDITYDGLNLNVTVTDAPTTITLANDDSQLEQTNIGVITSNDGEYSNVTLDGRTLYKDGTWNTLCLPFDIDDISVTPLKGATLKTLSSATFDNNTDVITINSTDANSIEAGKPYLLKWDVAYSVTAGSDMYSYNDFVDDNLVNGNKGWEWMPNEDNGFCEFHTNGTRQVTGYTLTTSSNMDYHNYNPKAWVLYGKLNESDEWTVIDSRNTTTTPADALPSTDTTDKYYTAANPGDYRYFRFEVTIGTGHEYNTTRLGELTLHGEYTAGGDDLIENPTFKYVTIKNELRPMMTNEVLFVGHFGTVGHIDGVMLDKYDSNGDAMHAVLCIAEPAAPTGYSFEGWCTDAGLTTPATAIPFDADDGSVTLYANITENVLELANAADNSDNIQKAATNGGEFKVTLADRTLWKDGDWNTLCLPINLGNPEAEAGHHFDGTLLEGATVMTLESTEFVDGTLSMNFVDASSIVAGNPYIIKWTGGDNLVNPVFTDVTINSTTNNKVCDLGDGKSISFVGTYSSLTYADENRSILFLGGGNKLYYPDGNNPTTINACRAYFTLNGITAGDKASEVKTFVLNFGEGETSIHNSQFIIHNDDEAPWYDLEGRRLNGKPTQSGIYIHNGRKVVIK